MSLRTLLVAGLATSATAVKLLVSGYAKVDGTNGTVLTLDYPSLKTVSTNDKMGPQPTWLDTTLYKEKGLVLGLDEAWSTPDKAGLYALKKSSNGGLDVTGFATILGGPVSTQFYNKNSAVAIAHYGGGAISTFSVAKDGAFAPLQNITYGTEGHGPGAGQTTSHVHHSVIDPTGRFLVFPDLGLDATHVFCIDPATNKLTAHADLKAVAGAGPRHAVFWQSGRKTFLIIVHELNNSIVSYEVSYPREGGLAFKEVDSQSTFGNITAPAGAAAGEIQVSPDRKFVLASNRNATLSNVANPDPSNSTQVPSDSIVTFKPTPQGKLEFVQLAPSGGKFPRHFSTNKDGSLVAVANQQSFSVDVYARDVRTGMLGKKVSSAFDLPSNPNNVLFVDE
ncbi:unnamed protein product [Periconia digitata]|uniref:6-phosphogluconolactonase n=1 Tax=Periconia digitata TaxID=1303443 RepID=A0A9W4XN53_9PLEO|nr:unnamed protein product [Periconia digitata]